ncbi:MAG: M20/M25/M40 family metallo-hydrolase [Armatimonadetes bacterium]|nr:M20/M25/M40 family metallo-hydrolase [Armatimonadota bacterium]
MSDETEMIGRQAGSDEFREWLAGVLTDLCSVDTAPGSDVAATARREDEVFRRIEAELATIDHPGGRSVRASIRDDISGHPFYSQPYYTAPEGGAPLSAAEAYAGRGNLLFMVDGADRTARGLALNAHIDVVRPYIAPSRDGDMIRGRGSCDDKGPLTAILGALRLVAQWRRKTGNEPQANLTAMFVIDEEMGGNGSLSLALDPAVGRRYDAILVLECTDGTLHPANRGAVWYRVEGSLPGANLFEAAAFIIGEMEREGRAIKSESRHPLFAHRPVQTCHGIIGGWGEHPSRINGRVAFEIDAQGASADPQAAGDLVTDVLESGLAEYVGLYGDKTQVLDTETGAPKVARHYELEATSEGLRVTVHGSTGHMGSILQNDGAITKAAAMVRALVASRSALEAACDGPVSFALCDWCDQSRLSMEGGQGFLPTHELPEVQRRLEAAVMRGAAQYLRLTGRTEAPEAFLTVTYDKLHNAAFAGDPASPAALDAMEAARQAGIGHSEPLRGWDVSCDARIFAHCRPDAATLTGGPGKLIHAHSDAEQISLGDLARYAEFLARYIILRTYARRGPAPTRK